MVIRRVFQLTVILFVSFLVLFPSSAYAGHLLGGEITYEYVGQDQYQIELTIYRDCFYADSLAFFDDPAVIGFFDDQSRLIMSLEIPFSGDDTLSNIHNDPCLILPPYDLCVHSTTYRTIINLPQRNGGYTLAYQRCCRQPVINNIIDPLNTGWTFFVHISDESIAAQNSSPKFRHQPPVFICLDEHIRYSQSASDTDGDSLVYSLCTPFAGAGLDDPQPVPPKSPPYTEVQWQSPYEVNNMIIGDPGLSIDPTSGEVSILPHTAGHYVVGICVKEYRDGELLSIIQRDFQYKVGQCGDTKAAFLIPYVRCNDLEVSFVNESPGNFVTDQKWYFGGVANPLSTSTSFDASFTFPDTGSYEVCLVTEPMSNCADTVCKDVSLGYSQIEVAFEYEVLRCMGRDSVLVFLNDISSDPMNELVGRKWVASKSVISTSSSFSFLHPGNANTSIKLEVTDVSGCTLENAQGLNITHESIMYNLPDTLTICQGDSIQLGNIPDLPSLEYYWSPSGLFSDNSDPSPKVSPDEPVEYIVEIRSTEENCRDTGAVNVLPFESFDVEARSTPCIDNTDFYLVMSFGNVNMAGDSVSIFVNDTLFAKYSYDTISSTEKLHLGPFEGDGVTEYLFELEDAGNQGCRDNYYLGKIYCGEPTVDPVPPDRILIPQPVYSRTFPIFCRSAEGVSELRIFNQIGQELPARWAITSPDKLQVSSQFEHSGWYIAVLTVDKRKFSVPFIVYSR